MAVVVCRPGAPFVARCGGTEIVGAKSSVYHRWAVMPSVGNPHRGHQKQQQQARGNPEEGRRNSRFRWLFWRANVRHVGKNGSGAIGSERFMLALMDFFVIICQL